MSVPCLKEPATDTCLYFCKIHLKYYPSIYISSFLISGQFVQILFPSQYRLFYNLLSTLDIITVTVFGESVSCKALHYVIFCPSVNTFLVIQISCSVLYSEILSVCQSNKLSVFVFPLGNGAARIFYVWVGSQKNYLQI